MTTCNNCWKYTKRCDDCGRWRPPYDVDRVFDRVRRAQAKHIEVDIIRHPGKFEGEPTYAPYFWDAVLDGGGDEEVIADDGQTPVSFFNVLPEDREKFPSLANVTRVEIWEDQDGFVHTIATRID